MFLLDTNVISELRVGKPHPSAAVRHWAAGVASNQLYLTAITVLELETGVLTLERRDRQQSERLRAWLNAVLEQFQILPFGKEATLLCAAMHIPNRRPERDAMIAATSKEHSYTVITCNTTNFDGCGVALLNPWLTVD